jgi:hypothetical protein
MLIKPALTTVLALLLITQPGCQHCHPKIPNPAPLSAALRYNEIRQISSHNSYNDAGRKPCLPAQFQSGVRSFELDLHPQRDTDNWQIFHFLPWADYVQDLKSALALFNTIHTDNPDHEVITIWLQVDQWTAGHLPADLNRLIDHELPSIVYTPREFALRNPNANNLREVVKTNGWPRLDALKNKFIFVIMGSDKTSAEYLAKTKMAGICFAASENRACEKLNPLPDSPWLNSIFFNCHNTDGISGPRAIYQAGYVSRIWRVDNQCEYNLALDSLAHHIATDHVTKNLFRPLLQNSNGKPFLPNPQAAIPP